MTLQGGEKYEELRELIKHVEEEQEKEIEVNLSRNGW